ncbi:MAG: DUF3592 domain-containing protein [Anaerolineae bacterium]|jgi:hypothetical protein|nr:DUF3592 domain-containing protein [Anaerolineae bacterium]
MNANLVPALFAMVCGGIFTLALVGLGIFLVLQGVRSRSKAADSQTWPSVVGMVEEVEVRESRSRDEDGHIDIAYYPHVGYAYDVAGQSYRAHRVTFGAIKPVKQAAIVKTALERYPLGSQVTVYYNPQKPSEAVLERDATHTQALLVIGIVCLGLALCGGGALILGVVRNLR